MGINHLILAEDYEETVESDRKNGRNTASEDRIFREEKCRHVKFRKKLQTVANGLDSCYLKKKKSETTQKSGEKGLSKQKFDTFGGNCNKKPQQNAPETAKMRRKDTKNIAPTISATCSVLNRFLRSL